ncbi:MAG: flagellin FliC [SAR324 cluster bacterium]|uniref:Flagellin n=1 Tax=SAR324 cluster bacterium TaxID=2024889 RepID=A0A7X9FQ35_9DELT|nr:flagellin FliC [SAR324 cluster bacterium]
MAISLQTNVASLEISNKLNKTSESISDTFGRLSSGLRITRPGDDPAGAQIADTLKAQAKLASAAMMNANTAISFTSIADSALSGVSDMLTRMAELAEQSANGVYANSQRSALSNEFVALGSEIQRIAKTTQFNGVSLLSNSQTVTIQVGIDGTTLSRVDLAPITGTLNALGLAASGSDSLTYSILGTTEANSYSASRAALDAVTGALNSLNATRGSIGATESLLKTAINYLQVSREQFSAAESRIRDADIASEVSSMVRQQVLQQAQSAVLSQANQQVALALTLLQ